MYVAIAGVRHAGNGNGRRGKQAVAFTRGGSSKEMLINEAPAFFMPYKVDFVLLTRTKSRIHVKRKIDILAILFYESIAMCMMVIYLSISPV